MFRSRLLLLLVITIAIMKGCSTVKQGDHDKSTRAFIDQFEKNLAASDEVIMKQFQLTANSEATEEGILKAIHILQNQDQAKDSILCNVNFQGATLSLDEVGIRVEIPARFSSLDPAIPLEVSSSFTLWLSNIDDELFITNIEAQDFYFTYQGIVSHLQSLKNREKEMASRKIFFEQALVLEQTYDSVVWYTKYRDSIYYYVVNGPWTSLINNDEVRADTAKMGLVSETGRVIIPAAYDLVGTIGFEADGIIEVKKGGLVGHFNMAGQELVQASYDWIIPYPKDAYALVKQDSTYGWIDTDYTYHPGFPTPEAEQYVREFNFLNEFREISYTTQAMVEILSKDDSGYGIVIPPNHLVKAGVLEEIIPYMYLGNDWGGTEKIETEKNMFQKISDNISALVVGLNEYYVEGREGFYKRNNLTFVNNDGVALKEFTLEDGALRITRIDSTLLEVTTDRSIDLTKVMRYEEIDQENGFVRQPNYSYYKIEGGDIAQIQSDKRRYDFTGIVKIDSSYLIGTYMQYDEESENSRFIGYTLLRVEDIQRMRDEILAEYGFIFTDPEAGKPFARKKWYQPLFQDYNGFLSNMTEIDRHNLEFLEKIIETRDKSAS